MSQQADLPERTNFSHNANYRQSIRGEDLQLLRARISAYPACEGIHAISSTQRQTADPTNLTSSDRERRDTFSIFRCDVCESDRISLRVGIFMARILVRRLWKCLEKGRTKHRAALLRPHLRKSTFVFARGRYCNGNETCCASSSPPHPPPLSS